ncbi:MAG: formylglycine-generating enzyme family protein [Nitrospiraceae bacterium]
MRSLPGTVGILALLLSVNTTPIEAATQPNLEVNDMPKQLDREITGKDGARMVLIPAGNFIMGSTEGRADEEPVHQVSLDAFYLDKYEVTNKLFQNFVQETGYETTAEKEGLAAGVTSSGEWEMISGASWQKPEGSETIFESNREEHPVVSVSWYDADAYCRWADKRLPTEAEFEYANRAGTRTVYWWGDGNPSSQRAANIADESAARRFPGLPVMTGYDDGYERTAPVGSFNPNPWGLYDITGNVWEWTADWYDEDYYRNGPERNPIGPFRGTYKVLRGGSWHNGPLGVRSTYRRPSQPAYRYDHIGCRCAKTP